MKEELTLESPVAILSTLRLNIKKFYFLLTQCIYVFCMDLRKTAIISLIGL
jgi:hypothetical protein